MSKQHPLSWVLFAVLSLIWGSAFILMKRSAVDLTGWQIGSLRIFAAGLVMLPFGIFHLAAIPFRKLPLVVLSGLLGNFFPAFLFAIAIEKQVDSALAGILNSLTPLFVVLIGIFFFRERVRMKKMAGVLTGFAGLVILSLSKGSISFHDLGFTALILIATLLYGFNVNIVAHHLRQFDPIKIATVSLSFLTIPCALIMQRHHVFSIAQYDAEARESMIVISLLGIGGSAIATAMFYLLIKKSGALFASLVTYAIPAVAIIWGIWAGEDITALQVGCLGLILAGVYLANR